MQKRTMAIFALACTESLGNKCVQANQKPSAKKRKDVNKDAPKANGGNGHSAVGEATDHHGIDDRHAHPPELGEDQRNGELQSGPEFGAKCLEVNHLRKIFGTSVSGADSRSKGPSNLGPRYCFVEAKQVPKGNRSSRQSRVTPRAYWTLSPIDLLGKHPKAENQ